MNARRWVLPSLLVACGIVFLLIRAVPRISDGAHDIRTAHHAMHDESIILERVWAMVDRGDLHHQIGAYPGLYPYSVALVRLAVGTDAVAKRAIRATRWLSLYVTIVALIVTFVLFSLLARNPWVGALTAASMSIHPQVILFGCRIHPDAFALLFTHASLAFLGLAFDTERPRHLVLATVFAALSAATKLYGAFIMPIVAAFIAWRHWSDRRTMIQEWIRHAAIFGAIFLLLNPNLLLHPKTIIKGFLSIQEDNAIYERTVIDWWNVLLGADGLGWFGTIVAIAGLVVIAFRRRLDGVTAIAGFAVLYLLILVSTVEMTEARYAFPAMWPLLFVGLAVLVPRSQREPAKLIAVLLLTGVFLVIDLPKQKVALNDFATLFERTLNPQKLQVAHLLRGIHRARPGLVVSSPYVYVPAGIEWLYVWSFEDQPFPKNARAIVIDHHLRSKRSGPNLRALLSGAHGFVATATIGDMVVFEKR